MTRKERKRVRKQKHIKSSALDKRTEELARAGAKIMTQMAIEELKRNSHLLHKIVKTEDGERGCYDATAKIHPCSKCFAKDYCSKWETGGEEYYRRQHD